MLDIGLTHKKEYELDAKASGDAAAEDSIDTKRLVIGEAPGRLHYLGDNCQRGAGLYLSSAVNAAMRVAVSGRNDSSLRFFAGDLGEHKRGTLANLRYKREDRWANYVKVAIHLFGSLGYPMKGMNFTVAGTVPKHIALSSSGAIEVAAAVALRRYYKSKLTDMQLVASLAQAKKEFFGEETSIVEYMVHFFSKKDTFLVIDENTLDMRFVKSPVSKYHLLITDSNVSMIGVDDDIESRRDDIDEAVKLLSKQYFQRQSTPSARRVQTLPEPAPLLRDFIGGGMEEALRDLDDDVRRHCIHAMKEVEAVKNAEKALRDQDVSSFAKTIYHSHESLRDYYEVSCPEIDWLVKRAQETPGVLAARMTGRGFGGCTYTFLEPDAEKTFEEHRDDYERIFGFHPIFHTFKVGTGARIIHDG